MKIFLFLLLLFSLACGRRSFRVLPGDPDYLLRSPDSKQVPFREVLNGYNGFVPGKDWLDLRPRMELRVENAYYQEGAPKHGLNGYLGTEIAQYQVRRNGRLHLLAIHPMSQRPGDVHPVSQRPADQAPVQDLLSAVQQRHPHYRFFFEVLFKGSARGSVLLGASSLDELDQLTTRLKASPESVCTAQSTHCTVFPEACSVSLEMEIEVNQAPRTVNWNSNLASIAPHPRHVTLLRLYAGRTAPVQLDPNDPKALRLPLLPGDRIIWD
jgi:hypothetical protein